MGELDTLESAMHELAHVDVVDAARHERADELMLDGLRALCRTDEERDAVERLIVLYRQATGGLPPGGDIVAGAKTEPLPLDAGTE
jgi:hypothetical protein